MALTAAQQAEFDKVKAKVEEMEKMFTESLNLQAYGGYAVRNMLIDLKPILEKVEQA